MIFWPELGNAFSDAVTDMWQIICELVEHFLSQNWGTTIVCVFLGQTAK